MKARTALVVTFTAGAATAAAVWWRRRRTPGPAASPVQLGLDDGSIHALAADDHALAELDALAGGVRRAFESAG